MAKKPDPVGGFQHIEEQAFNAFREWPLWLMLRIAELNKQVIQPKPTPELESGETV